MNTYQEFIHKSRYARWDDEKGRRETFSETVERFVTFIKSHCDERGYSLTQKDLQQIKSSISNLEVLPSMRALMTAGKALATDNVAGFNCSFLPINHQRCFDELMYILMCGTGVGFSVESKAVSQLPVVAEAFYDTDTTIVVSDSKIGWASAFRELISMLYVGKVPKFNVSKVRPKGARLKTFGGRASGSEPLLELFNFSIALFKKSAGRKLSTLEVHDLVCKIADIVVVGGVRRSALISLSDLHDSKLRDAKSGQWWETNVQRALANNSAIYDEKPDTAQFLEEWAALYKSQSGERGIFNRKAALTQSDNGRRDISSLTEAGVNPCGEIILRPFEFCNLTEVVIRPEDTLETLKEKVKVATLIGTIQSTFTDFRYLRKIWKDNCEEERLLGVSFTGIMDNPLTYTGQNLPNVLDELKQTAIDTNAKYADKFGINRSSAITCVKPSGTVSQLALCSSGIHPSYSKYYIRTVRSDIKDPLATFLKDAGVPCEPDETKPYDNVVFSFPIKVPDTSVTRESISALDQLNLYKVYREHWCEHNPSITVYVRENEWLSVGAWVYENFDSVGGISFLPYSDHIYKQAPYQPIDEAEYNAAVAAFPASINWDNLVSFELEDSTTNAKELACSAGVCEL